MQTELILEWSNANLKSLGKNAEDILEISKSNNYSIFTVPDLHEIRNRAILRLRLEQSETLLLLPND